MNQMPSDSDAYANRSNESLISDLAGSDMVRVSTIHHLLVQRGSAVVPDLLTGVQNSNPQIQWESARVLAEIRDPSSAPGLVEALKDQNFVVRWVASEALATLQEDGLRPLLDALIKQSDSVWLRRGAHRVLHDLAHGKLASVTKPVLQALEGVQPNLEVPIAASKALDALKKRPRRQGK